MVGSLLFKHLLSYALQMSNEVKTPTVKETELLKSIKELLNKS